MELGAEIRRDIVELYNLSIRIKHGDITEEKTDAIVNAANNSLLGGGGVDGAIHSKGGAVILEQCKKHAGCPTGEARITTAGNLPCRYIIHTVGPVYGSDPILEKKLLYNTYFNSLKLADEYRIKTIAFPSISTGAFGYPIDEAVKVAFEAVIDFSKSNSTIEEIVFVLFSTEDFRVYEKYIQLIH